MEREGELVVTDAANVALHAIDEPNAGLGGAQAQYDGHLGPLCEGFEDRGRIVELKRISMSPIVSFRRRRLPQSSARIDAGLLSDGFEQGDSQPQRGALEDAVALRFDEFDSFENFLLGFGAKAFQAGDAAGLRQRL